MTVKREVWVLEDAVYSKSRIRRFIRERTTELAVRIFSTRLEMEAAWQAGQRPLAIVLDLLAPDEHFLLVQLLLLRNTTGWRRWIGHLISPFLRMFVRMLPSIFPSYVAKLEGDLVTGVNRVWGGVSFLQTRARCQDLSIPVYIYSVTTNQTYTEGDPFFGPKCIEMRQFIERSLLPSLKGLVRIFPKGFFTTPWEPEMVNDGLAELVEQLRSDLKIA